MKRNCSLSDISDGRLYKVEDLVEVSCDGCGGCATCCHEMGNSIILDPYDIYRLTSNLNMTFEQLLIDKVELSVVDGIILPNLKMTGSSESCAFLDDKGRCSVHRIRPGICRIFPLGRYYENHGFKYILQIHECESKSATKIRIRKWIDTSDIKENEQFIIDWHYFLIDIENILNNTKDESLVKNINMYLLSNFYLKIYNKDDNFYNQFYDRLKEVKTVIEGA